MAAYHGGAAQLAQKYLPIRLDALLRSPFRGFADVDAVLLELRDFESAPGFPDSMRTLCECGIKVVAFLAALPARERARRIELLNRLDCDPRNQNFVISVGFDGRNVTTLPSGPAPKPIFLNPQFAAFATEPLERLERYAKTGSELTPQEQQEEQRDCERRQRVWEKTRAFHESDVYKRARDAAWSKDSDPERIVRAVSALCEEMYRPVNQTGDDSLEIGYWTDKLTVNLVKLKRFDEALRWITRFKSAGAARVTPSVAEAISKRRARCEAALGGKK